MSAFLKKACRRYGLHAAVAAILLILSCDLGDTPFAPPVEKNVQVTGRDSVATFVVSLFIVSEQLTGGEGEMKEVDIGALVFDQNHNPLTGKTVMFSATDGIVTTSDTTGENGVAYARLLWTNPLKSVTVSAEVVVGDTMAVDTIIVSAPNEITIDNSENGNMQIFAEPSELVAANGEKSTIRVKVFDDNRNPVTGKKVDFTTTLGTVGKQAVTDSSGMAQVVFYSEPENGNAQVTGAMVIGDSLQSVSTTVTLTGLKVVILPQLISAPLGSSVPVIIKVLDGKGDPLADRKVTYTISRDSVNTTNGSGEVMTAVKRSTKGYVSIRAHSQGASDSVAVYFGSAAPVDVDNTVRSLRLFSSHAQLRADNSAEASITAILISQDMHNPLVGDTIEFSSTLGIVDKIGVTDKNGRATVVLRSAPVNGICAVTGRLLSNNAIKDSTEILFSGITVSLSADREDLGINDSAVITALLKDGSGNPISSDYVTFSVVSPGTFPDGSRLTTMPLRAGGTAMVIVSSATAGKVKVHAVSANVRDSVELVFTTNNISVVSSKKSVRVGGGDSTRITARYLDKSGNPLKGKTVVFAVNAGDVTAGSAVTDDSGYARVYLKSGYFSTVATVQAKTADGSAYVEVPFVAGSPTALTLKVTPDNIGVNGGTGEVVAVVKDNGGNTVSGADVQFKILKGPGGGEQIEKPVIATTNDGIARAIIMAGSLPSEYLGCEIEASVSGIKTAVKLTISGEPHTVTVSRPQDDTVTVPKGGVLDETTFEYYIGAVVKDVNGNPVADGTPVNFSSVVSGMAIQRRAFDRFEYADGDVKPVYNYVYVDIPFEDINGNMQYDEGIDLDLDLYKNVASRGNDRDGDGILDYNFITSGMFWDFNGNGICDTNGSYFNGENYLETSQKVLPNGDTTYEIYADLNRNGRWDRYECPPGERSMLPAGMFTSPFGFDFEYWRWEMRDIPGFYGSRFDFITNDFAVVIDRTVVTKNGVAYTQLTYPRQLARRLFVTVNAEVKGLRDRNGERFILPVIVQ